MGVRIQENQTCRRPRLGKTFPSSFFHPGLILGTLTHALPHTDRHTQTHTHARFQRNTIIRFLFGGNGPDSCTALRHRAGKAGLEEALMKGPRRGWGTTHLC